MGLKLASEKTFRRIVDTVLSAASAEHTSIDFGDTESSTLRFANNQVVQNVSVRAPFVSLRVSFGKRVGSASTNRLDNNSLRSVVQQAEAIARLAPEDPEYLPPLGPQSYIDIPSFRGKTAAAAPSDLAKIAGPVIERCARRDLNGAGIVSTEVAARGIAASTGMFGYEQMTEAEFSLTATAGDSSGWCYNTHRDISALGVEARTRIALEKAVRSKDPTELPPGHYPVILEPSALAGILGSFLFSLDAKSYYKGNSALAGKLGSQLVDPRLTLRSDPAHADLTGTRWDRNGLATKAMTWIESGVLKQISYDRFTAQEHNVPPTPFPAAPILSFTGPKAQSIEELIGQTKRAVLITNFWYIRSVDPADLTVTGMTRDGTFLVEEGKIIGGVRNFRFHDSPLRCLQQVEAATKPLECITLESSKMLLPAVRLPDFHLSSVTKF